MVVAWSRVLLGVHWYTDVIAGLTLGWGWCALCWVAVELSSVRPDADPADDHRDRRATNRRAASTTAPTNGRPEGDGVEGARGVVALAVPRVPGIEHIGGPSSSIERCHRIDQVARIVVCRCSLAGLTAATVRTTVPRLPTPRIAGFPLVAMLVEDGAREFGVVVHDRRLRLSEPTAAHMSSTTTVLACT